MKKVISIFIAIVLVLLPCLSITYADDHFDTSIVVSQTNTSYAGWSNTSPTHYGEIQSGISQYPISLCSTTSSTSVLEDTTVVPSYVDVYVSNELISEGAIVYLALCNAYGSFLGTSSIENLFAWNDSIPGYTPKYANSSSMGYTNPSSSYSFTAPSSFSVQYNIYRDGTSSSTSSGTATVVGTYSCNLAVPVTSGNGSVYNEPYYKSSSNNCRLIRQAVVATSGPNASSSPNTIRFRFDSNDLVKCTVQAGNTNGYLHSAIFIPVVYVVPTSSNTEIAKLDSIVSKLTTLVTSNQNIANYLQVIQGMLSNSDMDVIDALDAILSNLVDINNGINAVTGNQYDSAIQYIEYYMNAVLSDTDTMVTQLNNITATLNNIANTIGAANTDAQNAAQNAEDVHEYEQDIYSQANIDIGSTVISSFSFDANTSSGLARAGLDFTNLWSALRQWNVIYTFSMILTLAFTIIRFTRVSYKSKKSDKE